MNKKLEDYRDGEAYKEYAQPFGMPKDPVDGEYAYKTGFNAAMDLDLAVKFTSYLAENGIKPHHKDKGGVIHLYKGESHQYLGKVKDVYEYWLTNVFKFE